VLPETVGFGRSRLCAALIKGQILIDPDQPEALTTRSLEVKMRIRYVEPPDTEIENFPNHLLHVIGLYFQPHSPTAAQEFAFIGDVPIEERDIEVVSQANDVSFRIHLRDLATEDIAIESANAVSIPAWDQNRRMIPENCLCHGYFFPE
jgi:hypothetical protein